MQLPIGKINSSKEMLDFILPSIEKEIRQKIQKLKKSQMEYLKRIRESEKTRMLFFSKKVSEELKQITKSFPNIDKLSPFYKELVDANIGITDLKKSWSRLNWAMTKIEELRKKFLKELNKTNKSTEMNKIRKAFYGRAASILKSIDKELRFLESARKKFRSFPSVKQIKTIVLAGYPNVGKTSLLKAITGSEPEINSYPFTTKGIKVGFVRKNKKRVLQIIDTPGMLDRPLKKRNKIEMQSILALKHLAEKIFFVMDVTPSCGYTLDEQLNLYEEVKKLFKEKEILLIVNKSDLISNKVVLKKLPKHVLISASNMLSGKTSKEKLNKLLGIEN